MKKHYLLGCEICNAYDDKKLEYVSRLLDDADGEIVTFDTEIDNPTTLINRCMGYDHYIEVSEEDYQYIMSVPEYVELSECCEAKINDFGLCSECGEHV